MSNYIEVPIIRVKQKIGDFFIGKMTPKQIHSIANRNLSRQKDVEEGIQRDIQATKIKEIKEYLALPDATFPNTIILSIAKNPSDDEEAAYLFDDKKNLLLINKKSDTANILDGQHRLGGFDIDEETFELPVSIFLDLALGEQAKIFAKINSTQKKVSLDLVYDLFGITEERSPEKVAFYIVRHLNTEPKSAWYKKIKTLSEREGDLAQGSMAKYFHKELLTHNKIFKDLYLKERDTDIKNILMNYFNAIQIVFPVAWENGNRNYILTRTTGFNGFMSFFSSLVEIAAQKRVALSTEYFLKYLEPAKNNFDELVSDNYPSGAKGQIKIRNTLRESLSEEDRKLLGLIK